jgi:hypothetical protein
MMNDYSKQTKRNAFNFCKKNLCKKMQREM